MSSRCGQGSRPRDHDQGWTQAGTPRLAWLWQPGLTHQQPSNPGARRRTDHAPKAPALVGWRLGWRSATWGVQRLHAIVCVASPPLCQQAGRQVSGGLVLGVHVGRGAVG